MISVKSRKFLLFLMAAVCMAVMLMLSAVPSYAYIDRGSVTISDPDTLVLQPGETTSMEITPYKESHYPGCQMSECPTVCGEKDCIVIVNGQEECTCQGTEMKTYYAVVKPGSSDTSVATAEYNDRGEVIITAVGPGKAQISCCADFREYKGASKTVNITVQSSSKQEADQSQSGDTANPSSGDASDASGSSAGDAADDSAAELYQVNLTDESECHASLTANPQQAAEGDPVMITASASQGYTLKGITVTDDQGNVLTTKGVGGIYEFTMPAGNVTVCADTEEEEQAETKEFPFTDVAADRWSRSAVEYVYNQSLFNGTSETLFSPEMTMTRGMLVTVLYRLEGSPEGAWTNSFNDVAAGSYYEKAVGWASEKGLVLGTGEGQFSPDLMITREQMVTILYRYAEYKNYSTEIKGTLQDYSDDNRLISSYAETPFKWAATRGIVTGVSSTSLAPQGNATREQVAAIIMRFVQKIVR